MKYETICFRIDSLVNIGLQKSALKEVERLDELAHENNNTTQQLRAVIYRITFQSYLQKDALTAIITRLKTDIDQAGYPAKPVLQSLLAQMYWNYYQQNRYRFGGRNRLEKPDTDFTKWDLQTIIDETSRLYGLSLHDAKKEQNTPVSVLDGLLEGDSTTRYLRPTLYDLLVQRAFDFYLTDEPGLPKPRMPFSLNDPRFFSDSRAFANLEIKTTDTASTYYKGIRYLQQASKFHLEHKDEEALADLDMQRLKFLYYRSNVERKDSLYLSALKQIAEHFSAKPISADAFVLIGKHYQEIDSLITALTYYTKVVAMFPESIGGKNAANYIKTIRQTDISATVEDVNIPGKPLLALLNYRNVKTARVTIYKIWATQYNELANMRDGKYVPSTYILPIEPVINYLKKLEPLNVEELQLPGTEDYRTHATEFKIDQLQSGIYIIIVQDALTDNQTPLKLAAFKVCRLSFVARRNPDSKIQINVMDRETGALIPGIQVTIAEAEHKTTDNNGACFSDFTYDHNYSIKLTTNTDTLFTDSRHSIALPYNNYSAPVNRTVLFTDRQIYRPGQTVYFKGIYIQAQNGKNSLLVNEKIMVNILDDNRKPITSIPVVTNEFGSFIGTFIIPQTILNGYIFINTGYGNKLINVEEYKRPSFVVGFLPVKNSYKPNDSVTVTGTVVAYSGYGISQARVVYHITRQLQFNNYLFRPHEFNYLLFRTTEIVTDTVKTNHQGQFEIKFKALVDERTGMGNLKYVYNINTDVTDGSGETRSANSSLIVAVNNLTIVESFPKKIFTSDTIKIPVEINNLNGVMQSGDIRLKIFALKEPDHIFKDRLWNKPDQYLISRTEYKKDFPEFAYGNEDDMGTWAAQRQITDMDMKADGNQPVIFTPDVLKKQPTGTYKVYISATDRNGDTASVIHYFYFVNEPAKPQIKAYWVNPLKKSVGDGKPAEFLIGTGNHNHVLIEKYGGPQLLSSEWLNITGDSQQLVKIPVGQGENNISVQFLMVYQNRLYIKRQDITNTNDNDGLDIKFLTFRNKLQPGEKEQWKLQITGKNKKHQAAEMVADLYDASLDAIAGADNWDNILNAPYRYSPGYFDWDYVFTGQDITRSLNYKYFNFMVAERRYERLVSFVTEEDANKVFTSVEPPTLRELRVGYGSQKRKDLTGSVSVMIRGAGSTNTAMASEYSLQGQPAGVAIMHEILTKPGDKFTRDVLSEALLRINATPISLRTNFAETAFFYPQLHTDENGGILIDFTIPEVLTRWKFRGFAHTKDLHTGYIENTIVTQKQLSISANAPRFLREGDTITISARVANLTAGKLKGKVQMQLFNALNMQPVALFADKKDAGQPFEIGGGTTKAVSFRLVIPSGLDALTYRLTADAGEFTDGEENTLPVLPNRMLVTESMPMMVRAGQTRAFTFDKLVNQSSATLKSKILTLEYTQNPAWYAVQALPYMMEFPYECSEQVFSRYYANSLATSIVNKLPAIKQVFDQWKSANSPELLSNLEKNQELKATLIEETPWLQDAVSETEQKKRIGLLFDLNKMSDELKLNLDKLQKRQLPDGGFTWFGGDRSDRYITQHIAEGMGELYHLGIADSQLQPIADNAIRYLDDQLAADEKLRKKNKDNTWFYGDLEIHAWFTRSYFLNKPLNNTLKTALSAYLKWAADDWKFRNVYEQGVIALTMQRYNKPKVCAQIERSLLETAQQSDDLGMYWAKNQQGYFWYESPIETQSLLIELFTEAGGNTKAVDEMKIWLLRNKQTSDWKTTKATAAACYALLLKGNDLLADTGKSIIKLDDKPLEELKSDVKADAGTGYIKTSWADEQIKPGLGKVEIKNNGKTISWGALHWQYLENLDKVTSSQTNIHLERKYFIQKQTDDGPVLTAVDAAHPPKTGDLLKVVVYLKADRDFEYVQLKDMRPAGTEPADALSTYKYQDGLYYYQATKDVATNFFISNLSKGNYVFEYQLRVAQPGNFSTGITSVQCMYAPEFNAHSQGDRLTIK